MWKDYIRSTVVIFQPNILKIVGFYVRHSASLLLAILRYILKKLDSGSTSFVKVCCILGTDT